MDGKQQQRRLGLGGVAAALGVPRLTAWWWQKTGKLPSPTVDDDDRWWLVGEVYAAALEHGMADRVPILHWPDPSGPAPYLGIRPLDGAVALQWETEHGVVSLVYPLEYERGDRTRLDGWADVLHRDKAAAVLQVYCDFGHGPSVIAARPALLPGPDRHYEPWWEDLARIVGQPVPYWEPHLTEPRFLHEWTPGADPIVAAAAPDLDVAALLRLAATYDADHPASQVLVNLARVAQYRATGHTEQYLGLAAEAEDAITIPVRPMSVPEADVDDPDPTVRRAGWLDILSRTDILATDCVRQLLMWDAGKYLPFGNPATITPDSEQAAEWVTRLTPTQRTAAHAIVDSRRRGEPFLDPATDAPVVREHDGEEFVYRAAIPQRLPTHSPLAELILSGPIWVRTKDGTIYPAPRDSYYGISWGYSGSGPGALALLIDRLLNDITAQAADDINGGPAGLDRLTRTKLPKGTVLTRAQLEAARAGKWLPVIQTTDDPDDPGDDA